MKLLFLHGPPAAGKLTIAKTILTKVDGKLFDNHVSIDVGRDLFEFGTPEFWNFVDEIRYLALEKAAASDIPLLIFTGCYSDPEDWDYIEKYQTIVQKHGGSLLPVYLSCSTETLKSRLGAEDRKARRKLTDIDKLDKLLSDANLVQVPLENCLLVNSEKMQAEEAAEFIIRSFGLAAVKKE